MIFTPAEEGVAVPKASEAGVKSTKNGHNRCDE